MNRLTIWDENKLKNKIAICIEDVSHSNQARKNFQFPLPDILCSFYKTANIKEDFYSFESFKRLFEQYKKENKNYKKTIEGLIEEGWISLTFGRWKSALGSQLTWEEVEKTNDWEFPDSDVIRFLLWLKHQELEGRFNVEIVNPKEILKGWNTVCNAVPDLGWFINENYLVYVKGKYYANSGRYWWDQAVDQALAKLWLEWRENKREDWITVAMSMRGSYHIGEYLEDDALRELIHFILDDCIYKYPVP